MQPGTARRATPPSSALRSRQAGSCPAPWALTRGEHRVSPSGQEQAARRRQLSCALGTPLLERLLALAAKRWGGRSAATAHSSSTSTLAPGDSYLLWFLAAQVRDGAPVEQPVAGESLRRSGRPADALAVRCPPPASSTWRRRRRPLPLPELLGAWPSTPAGRRLEHRSPAAALSGPGRRAPAPAITDLRREPHARRCRAAASSAPRRPIDDACRLRHARRRRRSD